MLNVDWFQPFEHFTYSVGVIYLAILNLPRDVRYKRENIILVGIIPGPAEPPLNINTYLSPLCDELLLLWDGIELQVSDSQQLVRAALLAVSCDLPAGRKVCGFLSHAANLGCSRCYATFSEGFGQQNYARFDKQLWRFRSNDEHRQNVLKLSECKNKTSREKKESEIGCRYSELLRLPYFDPVRMLPIDPMHNLYLGSAKYITQKVFIGEKILTKDHLNIIQKRIANIRLPVHIGLQLLLVPHYTAEQWMIWTLYFCVYCLHNLIPQRDMDCLRNFVMACRRLSRQTITEEDIDIADALLVEFGRQVKQLYGESTVTPNMHMHCHLGDCLKDYGPLHAFWLFAFERYNGLIGNQPTNNHAIEPQLMKRFLKDRVHLELIHKSNCQPLLDLFGDAVINHANSFRSISKSLPSTDFIEPSKFKIRILSHHQIEVLKRVIFKLHPEYELPFQEHQKIHLPSSVKIFDYIYMKGSKLSSVNDGIHAKVPYVLAEPMFLFSSTGFSI